MQELPIHRLVFPKPVPAGMDWAVIGLWVVRFRKTSEPCDPYILVKPIPGTGFYEIKDGRHRVVAAMIAGRTHIEAESQGDSDASPPCSVP